MRLDTRGIPCRFTGEVRKKYGNLVLAVDEAKEEALQNMLVLQGFRVGEVEGTRTLNFRIDSPVL